MSNRRSGLSDFEREVAGRFGLVPHFFSSAPDAPEIIEKLWNFAQSAYLDNPIPSVFKERLFVYLSRFCENRYCITRHCAFLVGRGHASGDPAAAPQTIEQAIRLLTKPTPWQRGSDAWLIALETTPAVADWPAPETELEDELFAAASLLFAEGGRSERARRALHHALGGRRFEHLLGLVAFIRTAHYWTVLHPNLSAEEDVQALLEANAEMVQLLMDDPEAAHMAVPVALMVNELVTNAIKQGGNGCRIVLRTEPGDMLKLIVSDAGEGPSPDQPQLEGMGSRILQGLARQLGATIKPKAETNSYTVEAAIPLLAKP
jgi:hypothetical protein